MNSIAEVTHCEENLRNAMLASDVQTLPGLIDDRLAFTGHDGSVLTKEQDLSAHESSLLKISKLYFIDTSFHQFEELIISTTKADLAGSFDGNPFGGIFAYTRLCSRSSGTWQVIAGHASAIR